MGVAFPAADKRRALRYCVRDQRLEALEAGGGDEGADVDVFFRVGERVADAQRGDLWGEEGEEAGVGVRGGDDALDADAILARGLEDAAHDDGCDALHLGFASAPAAGVIDHNSRVLATELDDDRGERFRGRGADSVGDGAGADEGEMGDSGV